MDSLHESISDSAFDHVIRLMLENVDFAERFARDPVSAASAAGIDLDPHDAAVLQRFKPPPALAPRDTFDERLVLCSSPGY